MKTIKETIKEVYSGVVKDTPQSSGCCATNAPNQASSCCGSGSTETELGFSEDYSELEGYNPDADFGLGCGIPVAFAGIRPGDTVLDLGSGAGNDVFVARSLVGKSGKVIGVDITPEMIKKANDNKVKLGFDNVEFILGDIEYLSLESATVDVVVSNCVLNLVADKKATYENIYDVLKPNGHFAISDVVVSGPLTNSISNAVKLYAGCIAGAMQKDDYIATIKEAGFNNVEIKKEKSVYLPDNFLLQYISKEELEKFRASRVEVLSVTIRGDK